MTVLKAYSEYKETGLKWLGRVPAAWGIVPLWTLYSRGKTTNFPDEELLSVYRDHGVVPKSSRDDNFNKPSEDLSSYQLVRPGDMVINKMKAWQGSVAISRHRGIVSPAYFVYERHHTMDDRYLHYLLRSERYITGYLSLSKGIRINQWDLDPIYHSRMPVLVPSMREQRGIVDLLDRETAQIDDLIAKQERLIGLLAEKRQAIITHAVTKGLNPTTPTKRSGIPWLGEIPAHWTITKVKHYFSATLGKMLQSANQPLESSVEIPYLRAGNIQPDGIDLNEVKSMPFTPTEAKALDLRAGDLVVVEGGAGFGRSDVLKSDLMGWGFQNHVIRVRSRLSLSTNFLDLVLKMSLSNGQIANLSNHATIPSLSSDKLLNLEFPAPPRDEAERICRHVEGRLMALGNLTDSAESVIRLLKERRSALISAAVTGKIKVETKDRHDA